MPALRQAVLDSQHGSGLNGGGCDFAHLNLKAFGHWAELHACCLAKIFLDIWKAFPQLCRSIVLPLPEGDLRPDTRGSRGFLQTRRAQQQHGIVEARRLAARVACSAAEIAGGVDEVEGERTSNVIKKIVV